MEFFWIFSWNYNFIYDLISAVEFSLQQNQKYLYENLEARNKTNCATKKKSQARDSLLYITYTANWIHVFGTMKQIDEYRIGGMTCNHMKDEFHWENDRCEHNIHKKSYIYKFEFR